MFSLKLNAVIYQYGIRDGRFDPFPKMFVSRAKLYQKTPLVLLGKIKIVNDGKI